MLSRATLLQSTRKGRRLPARPVVAGTRTGSAKLRHDLLLNRTYNQGLLNIWQTARDDLLAGDNDRSDQPVYGPKGRMATYVDELWTNYQNVLTEAYALIDRVRGAEQLNDELRGKRTQLQNSLERYRSQLRILGEDNKQYAVYQSTLFSMLADQGAKIEKLKLELADSKAELVNSKRGLIWVETERNILTVLLGVQVTANLMNLMPDASHECLREYAKLYVGMPSRMALGDTNGGSYCHPEATYRIDNAIFRLNATLIKSGGVRTALITNALTEFPPTAGSIPETVTGEMRLAPNPINPDPMCVTAIEKGIELVVTYQQKYLALHSGQGVGFPHRHPPPSPFTPENQPSGSNPGGSNSGGSDGPTDPRPHKKRSKECQAAAASAAAAAAAVAAFMVEDSSEPESMAAE
ncbi:hypothetical protein HYH03_005990 [Edaphochlamys debaryana]|uniref:Uncharacterized protein n=1 Tax=Edaphochlamys debaryana TaxID=47281 RepID=A0A835Y8C2_9CHLO|nr:hypothetical protein HYH03_005990 [Edaphochlamys debaryana]|eukprot:KAG2496071.1 hypothetical protein HYH03_005990 [Edaphochlamys debaryana]